MSAPAARLAAASGSLRRIDHRRLAVRLLSLNAGLFAFGVAVSFTVHAHLGVSPWDVLHMGISRHTPLTFGEASQVVGLVIVGISWRLGMRPGFGTIANMILVGFWIDRVLDWGWIPDAATAPPGVRLAMLGAGLLLFGLGSGAYIAPRFGAGPRDSFMLAFAVRTGRPVAVTRFIVEATVCVAGWLLGGTVGVGTLVTVLLIGPVMQVGLRLFRYDVHAHAATRDEQRAVRGEAA